MSLPVSKTYDFNSKDPGQIGGKAEGLFLLGKIAGLQIPPFIVIPVDVFRDLVNRSSLIENKINKLNEKTSEEELIQIQNLIMDFVLPEGIPFLSNSVAVRSSALHEDGTCSSFAGVYQTELAPLDVQKAVKIVWASFYSQQAIIRRSELGLLHQPAMAVIVQKLVDVSVAGVVCTCALSTREEIMHISANKGYGTSVVDGTKTPDSWLVQYGKRRAILMSCTQEREGHLSQAEIHFLVENVIRIKSYFCKEMDIEFAFDRKRELFFVQARPLMQISSKRTVQVSFLEEGETPFVSALFAISGVFSGRFVYVENLEDLISRKVILNRFDVLLTRVITNSWSQYLHQVGAIVTKDGSPMAHAMILSRERSIPCLVGLREEDFQKLISYSGVITVDGVRHAIYKGVKKIIDIDPSVLVEPLIEQVDLDERWNDWIKAGMAFYREGKYWRKSPTYAVKGFEEKINLDRFKIAGSLIGKKDLEIHAKVIEGFVCFERIPYDEYIALFEGFSYQLGVDFNFRFKNTINQLIDFCNQFVFNNQNWDNYVKIMTQFRAFVWLSDALRAYSERHIQRIMQEKSIPKHYIEAYKKQCQESVEDLDRQMQEEIEKLTLKNEITQKEIVELSQRFRFEKNMHLFSEVDLNFVRQRVEMAKTNPKKPLQKDVGYTVYFQDDEELKSWIFISVENRILQSNAHHKEAEAYAILRHKLSKESREALDRSEGV